MVAFLSSAERCCNIPPQMLQCKGIIHSATKLTNNQWRIAESALVEALDKGINFAALPKKTGKKQPQPEHLRQRQEELRQTKAQAATTTKAAKPAKKPAATKTK